MITKHYRSAALLCLVVVASLLTQGGLFHPEPAVAQPGIMRWETVTTPNSEPGKNDVLNPLIGGAFTGSEVRDLAVGNDGKTLIAAVTVDARYIDATLPAGPLGVLMKTSNGGISWSTSPYNNLTRTTGWTAGNHVYNVVIAPDDHRTWMVSAGSTASGPVELWVTIDGGGTWSNAGVPVLTPIEAISAIDISIEYGNGRDFMFGTRSGNGAGRLFVLKGANFGQWAQQASPTTSPMDYYCVKFSPSYAGDDAVVVILADNTTTYYNVGIRDIGANSLSMWVFTNNGVSIAAQSFLTLSSADLSLPSDYSGQTASLRRAFVSLLQSGIYRIDDAVPATLVPMVGINSIAFFGTYAQGKLMAGSLFGSPCYAAVPTLFLDTPCTCAGSCGYKSLKPPTGAANQGNCGSDNISVCSDNLTGIGSAVVAWSPDGALAYAITGSGRITNVPAVSTISAVYVSSDNATLTGKLTNLGNDTSALVSFEYGVTDNYSTATAPIALNTLGYFSAMITGLTVGQTYHFRAKAIGVPSGITVYGSDAFYTHINPFAVTTGFGNYVDGNSAIFNGTLINLGIDSSATLSFEYGPTTAYGSNTAPTVTGALGPFVGTATGLVAGNTYHFRAKAVGNPSGSIVYGLDNIYIHGLGVVADNGTLINNTSAMFHGRLAGLGTDTSAAVSFEYGPTVAYGSTTGAVSLLTTGYISLVATGLTSGTLYHLRVKAVGSPSGVTVYSPDIQYAHGLAVTTNNSAYTGLATANFNGTLTSLGGDASAAVSFEYGTTTLYGNNTAAPVMLAPGPFPPIAVAGLIIGQTYHLRAKAVGGTSGTIVYGSDITYIHGLTVNTSASSYINISSAVLSGTLLSLGPDGSANVSLEYGPTTAYGSNTPLIGMSASGSFSGIATPLVPGGAYHYRAKAVGVPSGTIVTGVDMTYINGFAWWASWINKLVPNDESAFSISRNNGDTWNQLSLIDTTIDWFNDVALSADCTTVYLASVHRSTGTGCNEFDSVWRSSISPSVSSPLPASAFAGAYWERVLCHTTSVCCRVPQTDLPILRTVQSCSDSSDGGMVAWAAQYATWPSLTGGVMAWSPDYGDYWIFLTPTNMIQDLAFDSSKVMYTLSPGGKVQKLVFTGTAWSTALPSSLTGIAGHTIAARNGRVLVGAAQSDLQDAAVAYSADGATNWIKYRDRMPVGGNVHAIFDVDFDKNSFIYAAVDDNITSGTVYRNTAPAFTRWDGGDMMDISSGAWGADWWSDNYSQAHGDPPHRAAYYGIVQAFTGNSQPALYAAHDNVTGSIAPAPGGVPSNSGVCRTLEPRNGIPKPGFYWDCLDIFLPPTITGVHFTLEPSALKACGCCSPNTNTTLFAIDNQSGFSLSGVSIADDPAGFIASFGSLLKGRYMQTPGYNPLAMQGMLWAYTDCLAKKGPALRYPADQALIGADPVTGRNQQVDLSWEQLCLSTSYELQVAKDREFTLRINPQISNVSNIQAVTGSILLRMDETNMTSPAAWLAPGTLPENGSFYYWRIRSYQSATRQIAASPWSEVRSFAIKPGFIVSSPYYGVQLLSPNNGCVACKVRPAAFSWSPWKEATRYEFALAKDPDFKQVVKSATTGTTGYQADGALEYDTNYFWRVRAVEINGRAIPSDWSATFSFRTESAPAAPPAPPSEPPTPVWVWFVIGLGVGLVAVVLVFIIRTRS